MHDKCIKIISTVRVISMPRPLRPRPKALPNPKISDQSQSPYYINRKPSKLYKKIPKFRVIIDFFQRKTNIGDFALFLHFQGYIYIKPTLNIVYFKGHFISKVFRSLQILFQLNSITISFWKFKRKFIVYLKLF